jgi:hypothetical protein
MNSKMTDPAIVWATIGDANSPRHQVIGGPCVTVHIHDVRPHRLAEACTLEPRRTENSIRQPMPAAARESDADRERG